MEPLRYQSRYICRSCTSALRQTSQKRPIYTRTLAATSSYTSSSTIPQRRRQIRTATTTAAPAAKIKKEKGFWENDWTIFSADNAALMQKAQALGDRVLQSKEIPDEKIVIEAMQVIEFAAAQLTRATKKEAAEAKAQQLSTTKARKGDGILSLDGGAVQQTATASQAHPKSISISTDLLSSLAYKILTFPPVFITPELLKSYVTTQTLLERPNTIPEIFHLYASKPIPRGKSLPISYSSPNPDSQKQAIPQEIADRALTSAMALKNLPLAIAIIDTSFATRSFQRNKFLTKAFPAISGIALTPIAAGLLASQLPAYFPIADPNELVMYATLGMVSYVVGISTLGFVVVTTTNDHHERVSWAPGMPLRERWLREEERAAVDRVAQEWGFKEDSKKGEEQGVEWAELREWCGLRGMILDKTELLEGME